MKPTELWARCARWAGIDLEDKAATRLGRYRDWLRDEAMAAGGIGPGENDRIDARHIADSLLFAGLIDPDVSEIWDFGTGVGLPGIPLAILRPDLEFTLVDRSRRRVHLARRAVRVLDLENAQVMQGEIADIPMGVPALVSRAVLPPPRAAESLYPRLRHGGSLILGGSWEDEPGYPGWETVPVPREILDREVWLLMMRHP